MKNSIAKKIQVLILGACCSVVLISAVRMMWEVAKEIEGFVALGVFGLILAFQVFLFYVLINLYVQEFKNSFGRV